MNIKAVTSCMAIGHALEKEGIKISALRLHISSEPLRFIFISRHPTDTSDICKSTYTMKKTQLFPTTHQSKMNLDGLKKGLCLQISACNVEATRANVNISTTKRRSKGRTKNKPTVH